MASPSPAAEARPAAPARLRDIRLDFFRGIAMFIILIAHVPGNWLTLWIPARFGFSDATEIFVFCSGMASAIAFGRVFREQGQLMGTMRVGYRVWQVYWVHLGLFFAIAAAMVALNAALPEGRDYVGQLNLYPFFKNPQDNLIGLFTLSYVPNYFDILPMYLVILVMLPLVVALVGVHPLLGAGLVIAMWLGATFLGVNFPAEPWSARQWFFNPFGWQLIFFTGFALMAGWIPAPPVDRRLCLLAALVVLVIVPFAYFRIHTEVDWIKAWRSDWKILIDKTDFGILRFVHFLALAYVAWFLAGANGARILSDHLTGPLATAWRRVVAMILKVGQQSLAIFVTSMFLARLMGALLDQVGRSHFTMAWVNLAGAAILILVAYSVAWFKSQPWKPRRSGNAQA